MNKVLDGIVNLRTALEEVERTYGQAGLLTDEIAAALSLAVAKCQS